MLKAIATLFKMLVFSILVLMIGNWVSWSGRTLSQHVETQVSRAEKSELVTRAVQWTRDTAEDARAGVTKKFFAPQRASTHPPTEQLRQSQATVTSDHTEVAAAAPARKISAVSAEKIPASERQKLRELIRELNSSGGRD